MKKLFVFLSAIFSILIGFSFATPSVLNPSYTVNGNDVKIYRTDNSDGGYMDINLKDPKTNDRLHFGEVKMSDQVFTYTKQWEGNQEVWIIPGDGGDDVKFTVNSDSTDGAIDTEGVRAEITDTTTSEKDNKATLTRTVIPVVPKTGPSWSLMGIILASLIIFGGYIYIRKKADI